MTTEEKAKAYEEALTRWHKCRKEHPGLEGAEPTHLDYKLTLPNEIWLADGIRQRLLREMNRISC